MFENVGQTPLRLGRFMLGKNKPTICKGTAADEYYYPFIRRVYITKMSNISFFLTVLTESKQTNKKKKRIRCNTL